MTYGLFLRTRYTVIAHRVNTESVWFDHPKYCHITLKPSGLELCHASRAMETTKMGRQT